MDKKWNLQDIKPAESRRRPARVQNHTVNSEEPTINSAERPPRREQPTRVSTGTKSKRPLIIAVLIFIVLLAGGFAASSLMGGAKLTVQPRWREPVLNTAIEARRQAGSSDLPYEVLTLEAEGERQVTATGQEEVQELAEGKITITKTTPGQERLVKNTRFATPDGLVFRVSESVVVPGATDGQPGTVVADVFADEAGQQYNVPAGTKFTVPGFQEGGYTELFEAISATAISDFTGGFDGPRFIVDENELAAAKESLHNELRQALEQRLPNEKPAGFVVFDSSVSFTYSELPSEEVGEGQVKLKEKAYMRVPMFKSDIFASYIAKAVVPGYEDEPVRIEDFSVLTFEYSSPETASADISALESLAFKLTGKPRLVWEYDEEKLKNDLAGSLQASLNTILGGYPAIEKASASIWPFWNRSFPDDPAKINIVEVVGEEA